MLDFLRILEQRRKGGGVDIVPEWYVRKSKDLMIRAGDFYAVYNEATGLWETDEDDAIRLIDQELDNYKNENLEKLKIKYGEDIHVSYLKYSETRAINKWHLYCESQAPTNYVALNQKVIFSNTPVTRDDFASFKLPYALEDGSIESYDKLIGTLYSPEERHKLEWAIGCVVAGMNRNHHKFLVLYGDPGSGKSTVINIIRKLFEYSVNRYSKKGYIAVFDAKALGSSSSQFAMETFRGDPLVAIQHDGDLSRIEDNSRLNSLVAHEEMVVNIKNKSQYTESFNTFLFLASNKPVKITDAKSGILRRLIDVTPTGEKVPKKEYDILMKNIEYELGAIAYHCLGVYKSDPNYYDAYIPTEMMSATNDFYNFIEDRYYALSEEDGISLDAAWEQYIEFCNKAKVPYPSSRRIVKEELKSYFTEYYDRIMINGIRYRGYYKGFRKDRFISSDDTVGSKDTGEKTEWLKFDCTSSLLDLYLADCPAQYAVADGAVERPEKAWDKCTTVLSDISTNKTHYVKGPEKLIVIDFDIPDENGNKCYELNYEAAMKWPPTYAELSKSGEGIHLHYIYTGDVNELASLVSEHVEIKVFPNNKKSALRRKVSRCNDIQIATISSGLPLKGVNKVVKPDVLLDEARIRRVIKNALSKMYASKSTSDNIFVIWKTLEEAYESGIYYDVENMHKDILKFAMNSSHQAEACMEKVTKMHFRSKDAEARAAEMDENPKADKIAFFDIEIWPNLMIFCWMLDDEDDVIAWFNPSPDQIAGFFDNYLAIGYNNLRYDNPICYERICGADNYSLYSLSKSIIGDGKEGKAKYTPNYQAKNLSYCDAYDMLAAGNKKSLKAHEIELGLPHKENEEDWDIPLPEDKWQEAADYCKNDVRATKAVFNHYKSDFTARVILAKLAGGRPNDTTNNLTTKFIFGADKNPSSQFQYRFMGDITQIDENKTAEMIKGLDISYPEFTKFDKFGKPIFPGYVFSGGKSYYRDINPDNPDKEYQQVGEGGWVWSIPGYFTDVGLDDIASQHPSSIIAEGLFGPAYTARFADLVNARLAVKHEDWDEARRMLNGILCPFIDQVLRGELSADDLAAALKTAINSVYGLTSAKFKNAFYDPKNIDNIVAKRGALFMINLKYEVEAKGFIVAHVKTDSIKIPNATPEILKFVSDYGKLYGYNFEHEATYDKMVLINKAVYIAKYASVDKCNNLYGYCPKDNKKHPGEWTATGKEFQVPYIFKKLFSKEEIGLDDLAITFNVSTSLYLDTNESLPENEHNYRFIGRIGKFTPVKPGIGGGYLMRKSTDKNCETTYGYATGAKGYRWAETSSLNEMAKFINPGENGVFDLIDISYFDTQLNDAVKDITEYIDIDTLIA